MENINNISDLDNFILKNDKDNNIILLYFGAMWCGPCKQLKKKLSSIDTMEELPRLVVAYIDVETEDEDLTKLVKTFKVNSLPTQLFIKLKKNKVSEVARIEGYDYMKLVMEYKNLL
jgi:thiol:disulfide interchange protein